MKLIHLFYDMMNLYGEYGNVAALKRELDAAGHAAGIINVGADDVPDLSDCAFIYIGAGTERSQKAALSRMKKYAGGLRAAMEKNIPILATGNAFEMFGKSITDKNGQVFEGLGFFDFETVESGTRTVTDCKMHSGICGGEITGFINKSSVIKNVSAPMFDVLSGCGNTENDTKEGAHFGSFYGTHVIGPLLVRNKELCLYFTKLI